MNAWTPVLIPFTLFYGAAVIIRNSLFDLKVLPRKQFAIPLIGVGNLSVGGTGKTPHVEYLIRLLEKDYSVATLSRGYGRRTKGFMLGEKGNDHTQLGDEPLQYFSKFKNVIVAVDSNRKRGIRKLLAGQKKPDVILMDDSFQHRWVEPGLNILLTDFRNLYINDYLLPVGTLREPASGVKRANIIIVTKTDTVFPTMLRQHITEKLNPALHQKLLFSTIKYSRLVPLTNSASSCILSKTNTILLIAGIANPYPLEDYLRKQCENLETMRFPDHHHYTVKDLLMIESRFAGIITRKKIIVTTEKDAMRLRHPLLADLVEKLPLYSIGIEVVFHDNDKAVFDGEVNTYIRQVLKKNP